MQVFNKCILNKDKRTTLSSKKGWMFLWLLSLDWFSLDLLQIGAMGVCECYKWKLKWGCSSMVEYLPRICTLLT